MESGFRNAVLNATDWELFPSGRRTINGGDNLDVKTFKSLNMKTICGKLCICVMLIFSVMLLAVAAGCAGESIVYTQVNVENVVYSLNNEDGTASAVGYHSKEAVIPAELMIRSDVKANDKTYKVTSVGRRVFAEFDFSSMLYTTSLILGDNLEIIHEGAFKYSTAIKEIAFSGPVLPVLAEDAFDEAVYESATLIVPEDVEIPFPWSKFKNVKRFAVVNP